MLGEAPADFPAQLRALARVNPCGELASHYELAWKYPTVLDVIAALAARGYATVGVDVMIDAGGKLEHFRGDIFCGNWHLDRKLEQPWAEYMAEGVSGALRYIKAYVRRNDSSYWYVPVFMDEETYIRVVPRRRYAPSTKAP